MWTLRDEELWLLNFHLCCPFFFFFVFAIIVSPYFLGFCMTKPYGSLLCTSSRAIKDFITQEFCLPWRKWHQILILPQNFQSLAMNGLCRHQTTVAKRNALSRKLFGFFFGCEPLAWQSAYFVAQSNLGHETCFVALSFVVQAFFLPMWHSMKWKWGQISDITLNKNHV